MKDPISISVGGSDAVAAMTVLDYSNQDIGPGELMMISSLIIPFSAATKEVNLSVNPMIGSVTGFKDKRDPSQVFSLVQGVKPGVYPKGSFVTVDGSRWGEVTYENSDSVDVKWLDDESTKDYVRAVTMASKEMTEQHGDPVFGGIEALCDGLSDTKIQQLNLSDTGLSPVNLTRLANIFTSDTSFSATIRRVNLSANKCFGEKNYGREHGVDNDQTGWRAICEAFKGTAIETLVLSDIGAGPVAVSTLADAISYMAALSTVNLCDNANISVADIEAVKIAAPNVSIEH
jgi:hypothetical protein